MATPERNNGAGAENPKKNQQGQNQQGQQRTWTQSAKAAAGFVMDGVSTAFDTMARRRGQRYYQRFSPVHENRTNPSNGSNANTRKRNAAAAATESTSAKSAKSTSTNTTPDGNVHTASSSSSSPPPSQPPPPPPTPNKSTKTPSPKNNPIGPGTKPANTSANNPPPHANNPPPQPPPNQQTAQQPPRPKNKNPSGNSTRSKNEQNNTKNPSRTSTRYSIMIKPKHLTDATTKIVGNRVNNHREQKQSFEAEWSQMNTEDKEAYMKHIISFLASAKLPSPSPQSTPARRHQSAPAPPPSRPAAGFIKRMLSRKSAASRS
jgi:hypothetical protein